MAKKENLFWINKSSSFGFGVNALKYGDAVNVDKIDEAVLAKQIKKGNIGEIKVAVTSGEKKLIENQRTQILKLQEQLDNVDGGDALAELKEELEKEKQISASLEEKIKKATK